MDPRTPRANSTRDIPRTKPKASSSKVYLPILIRSLSSLSPRKFSNLQGNRQLLCFKDLEVLPRHLKVIFRSLYLQQIQPNRTPIPATPTEIKPYGLTLGQINARSGPANVPSAACAVLGKRTSKAHSARTSIIPPRGTSRRPC